MGKRKDKGKKKGGKSAWTTSTSGSSGNRMPKLLTRDQFRERALARDNNKCVICGGDATEVHHIIERRLFEGGGYYLDNAASVCNPCHLECEKTTLSCEEVRDACGITNIVLPEHFEPDSTYDKWGNVVQSNGRRVPGELFHEDPVQKMLVEGDVLDLFDPYIKFPRIYHLPWSPGPTSDDKVMKDLSVFDGQEVVVTEKMDGENTTLYRDYIHGRSVDNYRKHASRDWMKGYHAEIAYEIPEGWRFCGENCYAEHSIHYGALPHYFLLFNVFDARNVCLSFDDTVEWAERCGIAMPRVLYRGPWDEAAIQDCFEVDVDTEYGGVQEGYVVRLADEFHYARYRYSVAKFVRDNHVQQKDGNWFNSEVTPNEIRDE